MWRVFRHQGWHSLDLVTVVILFAATFALTWPAWIDIVTIAIRDEENSHILLVLPIALWLFWLRRGRVRQCRIQHRWAGPVICAAGLGLSAFGWSTGVDAAWHGGAVVALIGAVTSVSGVEYFWRFAPVVMLLAFLVPVPGVLRQTIALPLQTISAQCTQFLLDLIGVLADRSGNLIIVDGMPVAVAEACNGLRMVFALLLVTYAFAFSIPMVNGVRLLLLLASPVVAIVANVTRLVPTVLAYTTLDMSSAEFLHDLGGWLMLGIAFIALLGIEHVLRWALIPTQRFTLAQRSA